MKTKILVDMDGVLADVYKLLIKYQYHSHGIEIKESQLNGIKEQEAFPDLRSIVMQNQFFYHAPLMEDSQAGLQYLNDRYDLLIVSAATEFANSLNDKQMWLERYFPVIS